MWGQIDNKLNNIIGLLMNGAPGAPMLDLRAHRVEPNEEHAAQIAELLRLCTAHREGSREADARILQLLATMGAKLERLECMSQELLDAVAGMTAAMQKMRDAQAANHTETMAVLDVLKGTPAASDPDVAKAIEALTAASTTATQTADDINAETKAMADAITPPPPAPTPEPQPEPAPVDPQPPAGS